MSHRKTIAPPSTSAVPSPAAPTDGRASRRPPRRRLPPPGRARSSGAGATTSARCDWRQMSAAPAADSTTGHTTASLNQIPQVRSKKSTLRRSSAMPAATIALSRRGRAREPSRPRSPSPAAGRSAQQMT